MVDYAVVGKGTELLYNEFIVYDAAQARCCAVLCLLCCVLCVGWSAPHA